jgi:toxin ParE1/3/4
VAHEVIWSLPALEDIDAILNFLSPESPIYASELVDDFLLAASTLTEFPLRGRQSPDVLNARELFVESYRMIYEVTADRVEILLVIHMSRDIPRT